MSTPRLSVFGVERPPQLLVVDSPEDWACPFLLPLPLFFSALSLPQDPGDIRLDPESLAQFGSLDAAALDAVVSLKSVVLVAKPSKLQCSCMLRLE